MEFLILLVVLLFIVAFVSYAKNNPMGPQSESTNTPSNYKKRPSVLNHSERQMYLILQRTLGSKFIVLSKVRIEDFVDVSRLGFSWGETQGFRGRIKSRHTDFLICDMASTSPLLAVELDGKSHRDFKRTERDNFVNKLYEEIDLPIIHVPVGSNFANEAQKISELLHPGS